MPDQNCQQQREAYQRAWRNLDHNTDPRQQRHYVTEVSRTLRELSQCIERHRSEDLLPPPLNGPITAAVVKIKCTEETNEVGADEPYILVTSVDLTSGLLPSLEVTLYGPWDDVDQGEESFTGGRPIFWFIDNRSAKPIDHPDDVIFLVSLMENDDGHPQAARTIVKGSAVASLVASSSLDRRERVGKLRNDIVSALATPTGFPNFDDHIDTQELILSSHDLASVSANSPVFKTLTFRGDGGVYEISFALRG